MPSLYLLFAGIDYPWNWRVPWEYRALFIQGFYHTVAISIGATSLGLMLGIVGGLAKVSRNMIAREVVTLYVELFRGTPLLVQIYIFYFCVATVVHFDNPLIIGMITLAFFSGAYITEMVRAGIESIDKGQLEAAKSTGLNHWQTMRYIVFPRPCGASSLPSRASSCPSSRTRPCSRSFPSGSHQGIRDHQCDDL